MAILWRVAVRGKDGIEGKLGGNRAITCEAQSTKTTVINEVNSKRTHSECRDAATRLVRALGKQRHNHHQIGQAEQPLVSAGAGGFRSARDEAQMAAFREIVNVFDANPSEGCDFRVGEDFLARLYRDHGLAPGPRSLLPASLLCLTQVFDASCRLNAAHFPCNSRSVLFE